MNKIGNYAKKVVLCYVIMKTLDLALNSFCEASGKLIKKVKAKREERKNSK